MMIGECAAVFLLICVTISGSTTAPNIIFIIADDLGFADVGFRNGDIISPNIDALASNGVILNSSYVQPTCTPSRAAFLTGRYPYKLGVQVPIGKDEMQCLPLNEKLLPETLQSLGYKTHAIGKWHLGYCSWDCVPTRRGFDTFYGTYGGGGNKDTHIKTNAAKTYSGLDFWDNETPLDSSVGQYSADLYGQRAVDVINSHDTTDPMYMWLAWQNVHLPVSVPQSYVDMYPSSIPEEQRKYYGMITIMDEYIGKILQALEDKGMLDNSIIVFTTDNGGLRSAGATNYPLRGGKNTIYEGGTRGVTLVASPLITVNGVREGMFHTIDWFQTLMHAATAQEQTDLSKDGLDQYDMIINGGPSKRDEFFYQLDSGSAIRSGDYKLIYGTAGADDSWDTEPTPPTSSRKRRWAKEQTLALERVLEDIVYESKRQDRRTTMLFNLANDPTETTDLSNSTDPAIQLLHDALVTRIRREIRSEVVEQVHPVDSASDPVTGYWSPGWC